MAITHIHFTNRITNSHTPVESWDIPVDKLADETVSSYDHIDDFEDMLDAFARINGTTYYIAKGIRRRFTDNQDAINNAEPGEEPEELDYNELVEPRDHYLYDPDLDLDTLVRAYQEANGGPEYCTYHYITDEEEDED